MRRKEEKNGGREIKKAIRIDVNFILKYTAIFFHEDFPIFYLFSGMKVLI